MRAFRVLVLILWLMPIAAVPAAETVAILDFEPWVVEGDKSAGPGMLIELSALTFPGEPIEPNRVPPRRMLVEATAGQFSWIFQACHVPLPQHEVVRRLLTFEQGILVTVDSTVASLTDLPGKKIAVWTARFGVLPQLEQDNRIGKVEINDLTSGTLMLQEKRVEALLITNLAIGWHLARSGIDPNQFRFIPIHTIEGCLFANKQVVQARREEVGKRIDAYIADGRIDDLTKRYQGVKLAR